MNLKSIALLMALLALTGCVSSTPKPDNPYYSAVPPEELVQPTAVNGSIYQAANNLNLYGNGTARRVGDVITIVLSERTQSSKSASMGLDRDNSTTFQGPTLAGRPISIGGNPLSFGLPSSTSSFEGDSAAAQSNSLTGNITVTVHRVLPNGLLLVRGEKWLTLNQGDEYLRVSGLLRPQDLSGDNTVPSTKLADARITYSGTGDTHNVTAVGWISKFFLGPWWPF